MTRGPDLITGAPVSGRREGRGQRRRDRKQSRGRELLSLKTKGGWAEGGGQPADPEEVTGLSAGTRGNPGTCFGTDPRTIKQRSCDVSNR